MRGGIAWFAANPVAANLLMLLLVASGLLAMPTLPKKVFPDVASDVIEIRIEESLVAGGDRDMIQDLTAAAVNAALANAQQMIQEEMQRASTQLQIPIPGGAGGGASGETPT